MGVLNIRFTRTIFLLFVVLLFTNNTNKETLYSKTLKSKDSLFQRKKLTNHKGMLRISAPNDLDNDGILDADDLDDDNDGIPDVDEGFGFYGSGGSVTFPSANSGLIENATQTAQANYSIIRNSRQGYDTPTEQYLGSANGIDIVNPAKNTVGKDEFNYTFTLTNITPGYKAIIRLVQVANRGINLGNVEASDWILTWSGGGNARYSDAITPERSGLTRYYSMYRYKAPTTHNFANRQIEGTDLYGDIASGASTRIYAINNNQTEWFIELPKDVTSVTIDKKVLANGTDTETGIDNKYPQLGFFTRSGESFKEWLAFKVEFVVDGSEGVDFDGDGIPNHRDLDSDGDGIMDIIESGSGVLDANNDGMVDGAVGNNGLVNSLETNDTQTATLNYTITNTDLQGGFDFLDIDSDNDGVLDNIEAQDYTAYIAPSGSDTDGDGIDNNYETNPLISFPNTDNTGKPNYLDIDSDDDGIPDNVEAQSTAGYLKPEGTNKAYDGQIPTSDDIPFGNDSDGDGLDDAYDTSVGIPNSGGITPESTVPTTAPDYINADSDGDLIPDIQENGMANAVSGNDADGDGLDDEFEGVNTDPTLDNFDVNDEIDDPATDLPNTNSTGDVDYRDTGLNIAMLGPYSNGTLWLRGDIGLIAPFLVSDWEDQSGAGSDFSLSNGVAFKKEDGLNFNKTAIFNGPQVASLQYTGNLNPRSMFIVYNDVSTANGSTPFTNDTGIGDGFTDDTRIYGGAIPFQVSFGAPHFVNGGFFFPTSIDRPNNFEMHSRIYTGNPSPNSETYYLGKDTTLSNTSLGGISGAIAEVILYSDEIIPKERQVVESYLAIKYGFTLDAIDNNNTIVEGDYILSDETTKVWDYAANNSYHNDVAGIGKDDAWVFFQKQSKSSNPNAFVTIGLNDIATDNPSNTGAGITTDKSYLVWGHNNVVLATTEMDTPNVPTQAQCDKNERLNRVWKIVETGTVGNVEVAFTKSVVDTYFTSTYGEKYLVVADDASFTTNVVEIPLKAETINTINHYAGKYNFDGTKYFTIADKKEIEWLGATSTWKRGSGTNNTPDITDTGRLLIIDAQGTSNHANLVNDVKIECAYIKVNSKLVVGSTNYIEIQDDLVLDGEIRLVGDGQLIQTHSSTSKVHGTGKLYKDQQAKVPNVYRYHYWSSPVIEAGLNTYRVGEVLRDGVDPTDETSIPQPITWTTGYDGAPGSGTYPSSYTPITLSNYWIYTNLNDPGDGSAWVQKKETGLINAGQGFSMKSTGDVPQNLTFLGTPNDGTIIFNIDPEPATHLLGNPYPSALDMTDFINDNISSIDGTLYFWEHTGEDSATLNGSEGHNQLDYQGGYSQRNLTMGISAVNVPTTNSGLYDWENATDNGADVTQTKRITIDNTDYDIIATVTIDNQSGVDIVDKQGAGGSTAKVIVKNSGVSAESFKITFDNLVDVNSIYLYNDIASQTSTNDITITADNPNRNTTFIQTLTGNSGQSFSLNWTDVTEIIITTQNPNNLVLDNISFAKGGGITMGNGVYHEPNRYMAVGQGFFVSASATGGQIIFQNSQREYRNDDFANGGTFFFKGKEKEQEEDTIPILKIGMNFKHNSVNYHRQIGISFKDGNTFNYENGYDSEMFDVGVTDMFWGFEEIPDKKLIIAGVEAISDDLEVPIQLQIDQSQTIRLMVDKQENISKELFILDKVTGNYYSLSQEIQLSLEKGNYTNRFFLTFKNSTLNLENSFLSNNLLKVFVDNLSQEIVIQNTNNLEVEKIELFNILGQKVKHHKLFKSESEIRIKSDDLKSSIYIIKVKTNKGFINTKVLINSNLR